MIAKASHRYSHRAILIRGALPLLLLLLLAIRVCIALASTQINSRARTLSLICARAR